MKFFCLAIALSFCLSMVVAHPYRMGFRRDTKKQEENKAPENFCNNFTNSKLKEHCESLNTKAEIVCGPKLAEITQILCNSQYNTHPACKYSFLVH